MNNRDANEEADRRHMSQQQDPTSPTRRPKLTRDDTEQLLSYYQSPLANSGYQEKNSSSDAHKPRKPPLHARHLSSASTSDSDYSDSSHSDYSSPAVQRRTSIPSEGASDRRRMAIVEMDTLVETAKKNSSLRQRRGREGSFGSLALVAPPDAAPNSYSHLTPSPSNALIDGKHLSATAAQSPGRDDARTHHRSQSEAVSPKKSSSPRDVGIIGTARTPIVVDLETVDEKGKALRPPIFIHPQSRSSSPSAVSPTTPMIKRRSTGQSITVVTPEIGAEKRIDVPVASPVVVGLDLADVPRTASPESSPSLQHDTPPQIVVQPDQIPPHMPSSYLDYKPGIHSMAGPLPPPPRAAFAIDTQSPPPPRPPRLHSPAPQHTSFQHSRSGTSSSARRGDVDAMRQALQLPASVAKALAARPKSPSRPSTTRTSNATATGDDASTSLSSAPGATSARSIHRREGAFPVSSDDSPGAKDASKVENDDDDTVNPVIPPSLRRVDQHLPPTHEELVEKGPPVTEVHPLEPPTPYAGFAISAGSSATSFGTVQVPSIGGSEVEVEGLTSPTPDDGWVDVDAVRRSPSPSSSPRTSAEHPRSSAEHSHHARTIQSHTTSNSLSVDGHAQPFSVSPSGSSSTSLSRSQSPSMSRSPSLSPAPSPPPKSFRHSITTGLRRMSLPRSPSGRNLTRKERGSTEQERSSYEDDSQTHPLPDIPQAQLLNFQPSVPLREIQPQQHVSRPFINPVQPPKRVRKVKDSDPPAMFCSEVTAKRSAMERCMLYAQKINELWTYDCGLEEWVDEMRVRGSGLSRGAAISLINSPPLSPTTSPSTIPFTSQARQTSQSSHTSILTEATFPRRPDASAATDLAVSMKDALSMAPAGPPPLPYPSLASNSRFPGRSTSSVGSTSGSESSAKGYKSLMSPSTPTSKTGAFFASLGRKASVTRKDRGTSGLGLGSASSSNGGRLTKLPPKSNLQNSHPPSAMPPSATPTVPGGPRAPPNRMLRSQTIMVSPMPSESSESSSTGRSSTLGRRPSLYNIPSADSVHHSTPAHAGRLSNPTVVGGPRAKSSSPSKPPSKPLHPTSTLHPEPSWDPEFRRQVDKLSDLMPHADRGVLAGYLKRAGQDILAIGQYLEDEKNGCLRSK